MDQNIGAGKQKICAWFDEGTFVELGAKIKKNDRQDSLICGYGSMNGKLAYAFLQDGDNQKGAFDDMGAAKLGRLYEMAVSNGAPVVGVFCSSGTVIYDGIKAMSAYGKWMKLVAKASGVVPQIAVIDGVCAASAAALAAMMDFTFFNKETGSLYVSSPFVLGDQTGTSASCETNGQIAKSFDHREDLISYVRNFVSDLPSYAGDTATDIPQDDINRKVQTDGLSTVQLIEAIADDAAFMPLFEGYGETVVTGFARLGGSLAGIVANVGENQKGLLTPDAARKAAKFIRFCDAFGLPVVTLVNSEGVKADVACENAPFSSELARLAQSYASATCPLITVYVGNAFGPAYIVMGSEALGADVTYSLPDAKFGILSPEASVAFLKQDELNAGSSRDELIKEWTEQYASPEVAASMGGVDDIIDPGEIRQRIISAVYMTAEKGRAGKHAKHANDPM
ncbi:MAG: hypothetical protein II710_03365 [Clostridia bacterium]|nr:hypothetical protein [Clostridia bacterium]